MKAFQVVLLISLSAVPALGEDPREAGHLRQGTEYLEGGQYQKAARAFQQALRLNRDSAAAHKGLALAFLRQGAGETATNVEVVQRSVAEFREAVRLAPASADNRYQLARACLLVDDPGCAAQELKALQELQPALAGELKAGLAAYKPPTPFTTVVSQPAKEDKGGTRVSVVGNAVLVPVTFSHRGRTAQATMLLDTGASVTMMSRELASRLGLEMNRSLEGRMMVADGRSIPVWHTMVSHVSVGSKKKKDLGLVVVMEGGRLPFDGLLGMNFFRSFKYSLDLGNQVINWMQ